MISMPQAIRHRGLMRGSIVASKMGRDIGHVYMVMSIDDPFVECFDGRKRIWPSRPKKKRITHVLAIGQWQWDESLATLSDEAVNQVIREALKRKEVNDG